MLMDLDGTSLLLIPWQLFIVSWFPSENHREAFIYRNLQHYFVFLFGKSKRTCVLCLHFVRLLKDMLFEMSPCRQALFFYVFFLTFTQLCELWKLCLWSSPAIYPDGPLLSLKDIKHVVNYTLCCYLQAHFHHNTSFTLFWQRRVHG